ncbi:MAG: DeoR family transcriptional regulator [Candidatus Dojkabacteria bacterium]|jgi:predicted HTH transcriptional regulator
MEENQKDISIWSVLSNILGFLFGAFLIYKIINRKRGFEKTEKFIQRPPIDEVKKVKKIYPINERQYKILATISKKGTMTPSEIYALEPNLSTRTLRRDMDVLVEQGVVRQEGSTKSTKYTYIG